VVRTRVLLVEDNPDDEALALRALGKFDKELLIDVVRDGQEAVDYFFSPSRAETELPSLILLDLKLPKLSGFDVLERLKSNQATRRIPIVLLTSSKEDKDRVNGYDLGANSFIRKPIDFRRFTQLIQQLGEYWLRTNEPPPELKP
jgi:CheY-like chemotaxis protein